MASELGLFLFLIIGLVAGWLAGKIMKGGGFGLVGNLIVGVIGAYVGGWLFNFVGVSTGSGAFGSLVTALIGSIVLLFIIGLIKKN